MPPDHSASAFLCRRITPPPDHSASGSLCLRIPPPPLSYAAGSAPIHTCSLQAFLRIPLPQLRVPAAANSRPRVATNYCTPSAAISQRIGTTGYIRAGFPAGFLLSFPRDTSYQKCFSLKLSTILHILEFVHKKYPSCFSSDPHSPHLLCTFHIFEFVHKKYPSYFSSDPHSPHLLCTFHIYIFVHKNFPVPF